MPRYHVAVDGREFDITVEYRSERYYATADSKTYEITRNSLGDTRSLMLIDNQSLDVDITTNGGNGDRVLFMRGREIPVSIEDYHLAQMRKAAGLSHSHAVEANVKAPMPGLVIGIKVSTGDRVSKGQPLIVIEAMKMENIIKAKADGVVKSIHATKGSSVEKGDLLLELES